jgi:hypothetical protein
MNSGFVEVYRVPSAALAGGLGINQWLDATSWLFSNVPTNALRLS